MGGRRGGGEVAAAFVDALLETAERRGVDRAPLTRGLALDTAGRALPFARVAWDDLAELFERLGARVGAHGVEAIAADMLRGSRFFAMAASRVVSVEALLRFGFERVGPATYRNVGVRLASPSPDVLEVTYTIPPRYRGSLLFGHGTLASTRCYPRLLGLPDLVVDADLSPHRGVLRCHLPADATLPARAARAARRHLGALLAGGGAGEHAPLEHDVPDDLVDTLLAEDIADHGQRLAAHHDLGALARDLAAFARERFCADEVGLWVRRPGGGGLVRVEVPGGGPPSTRAARAVRPLRVGDREVGRLELDGDGAFWPLELERLLPWVALGVERCLEHATALAPRAVGDVAAAAVAWALTRREAAVLDLVARGLANKEVAAALGCGVKNVEGAVTCLLRKAGVESRTALVRAALSSPHAPPPRARPAHT